MQASVVCTLTQNEKCSSNEVSFTSFSAVLAVWLDRNYPSLTSQQLRWLFRCFIPHKEIPRGHYENYCRSSRIFFFFCIVWRFGECGIHLISKRAFRIADWNETLYLLLIQFLFACLAEVKKSKLKRFFEDNIFLYKLQCIIFNSNLKIIVQHLKYWKFIFLNVFFRKPKLCPVQKIPAHTHLSTTVCWNLWS